MSNWLFQSCHSYSLPFFVVGVKQKTSMFRTWMEKNRDSDGQNPLISKLIMCLRKVKVAVEVWDFLDPDRTIRKSLQ